MAKLYHAPVTRHGRYGPVETKGPLQVGNAGAARVSAAMYRVTAPSKRKFCYNPGWGNQRYSPRGGLVGFNERWLRRGNPRRRFLSRWGDQVEALGWTARDPFGPQAPPSKRHPSYSRLSRYDDRPTKGSRVSSQIKRGANRAYVLARLRRDGRADLIEMVESGALSVRGALAVTTTSR
jgi:hypothetical protein